MGGRLLNFGGGVPWESSRAIASFNVQPVAALFSRGALNDVMLFRCCPFHCVQASVVALLFLAMLFGTSAPFPSSSKGRVVGRWQIDPNPSELQRQKGGGSSFLLYFLPAQPTTRTPFSFDVRSNPPDRVIYEYLGGSITL